MNRSICIEIMLRNEGGYVNDPSDAGGETYAGISRRAHPDWPGWEIVDNEERTFNEQIPELESDLQKFYQTHYWDIVCGDQLTDIDGALAMHVFDMGVNAGARRSIKILQEIVESTPDGVIGPNTMQCIRDCDFSVVNSFIYARKLYYTNIAEHRNNEKFLKCWLKRVKHCTERWIAMSDR